MSKTHQLIDKVKEARNAYLRAIQRVSEAKGLWKPSVNEWNIIEITEHLYWAEHGGIFGMWKTLYAIRAGEAERTFEFKHKELSVDEIIKRTWQPKEKVPAVAAPRMGGTLAFWKQALGSLQIILDQFGDDIQSDELRLMAHPHPISGPVDFHQRLEFLDFHINRHRGQALALLQAQKN